ncbi:hypothetical protein B0T16DRAFT_318965 [Cercophora newfieldiana]|uniref:Uncharacterized protein n=1 Tax=Cercophora newfieldiana TaxID=92897 RepID=A0AA40CXX4_9PEZI|nr:hypothetical protein B0T16DRAFT_318965 [Cercophora newfieldiana]
MEPRDAGDAATATPPVTTSPYATTAGAPPVQEPTVKPGSFPGLTAELNAQLEVVEIDLGEKQQATTGTLKAQSLLKLLKAKDPAKPFLPGQPRIPLHRVADDADPTCNEMLDYLRKVHLTDALDGLLPYMRYIFVQTPSFRHINPLHHQQAHAREIKVNENPGLHLVWYYEQIFIKPIPAYFYSKAFWEYLKDADDAVYRAAAGFMRSYYFLIQYDIDFHEALKHRLIPMKPDGHPPTYEEFHEFIYPFSKVNDDFVSRRFHYGELRLTRINRTAFLFKGQLAYFHIYPQWGSFLEHILAPIITIFAVFSVVLNSMQVGLAALDMGPGNEGSGWPAFVSVSVYFPIAIIIFIAIVVAVGVVGLALMGAKDLIHGNNVRRRKKRGDESAGEKSHGMI